MHHRKRSQRVGRTGRIRRGWLSRLCTAAFAAALAASLLPVQQAKAAGSLAMQFAGAAGSLPEQPSGTAGSLPVQPAGAASPSGAHRIGDDVGDVLATDIRAYVRNTPIRSMNIDGYTAIVVEDLRDYGFDVAWTPAERKVAIYNRPSKKVQAPAVEESSSLPVGTKLSDVLYTDIKTYYEGREIPSYNLDGRTAIRLNDLDRMGLVEWNEEAKTISFTPAADESPESPPMEQAPLVVRETNTVEISGIAIGAQSVEYEGRKIGTVVNGVPMISLAFMGEALGYRRDGLAAGCGKVSLCLDNGAYGMLTYVSNAAAYPEHPLDVLLYWMGGEKGKSSVKAVPAEGGASDVYVSERDLKWLFGYQSQWDPQTGRLDIRYVDYRVDDYGLPSDVRNYFYAVKAVGYMRGSGDVLPSLIVRDWKGGPGGAVSSMALVGEPGTYEYGGKPGLSKYGFESDLELDTGSYAYDVGLQVGLRKLYSSTLDIRLTPETAEPVIAYPDMTSFGEISRIRFDQPVQGYIATNEKQVAFAGTVEKQVGTGLTVVVEREVYGGGFETLKQFKVPFADGRFSFAVDTLDDPRYLTKVTVKGTVTNPRLTYDKDVARFYLKRSDSGQRK